MPHLLCNWLVLLSIFYSSVVEYKRVWGQLISWMAKFSRRDGVCEICDSWWTALSVSWTKVGHTTKIEVDKRKPSRELAPVSQGSHLFPGTDLLGLGFTTFRLLKSLPPRLASCSSRSFQLAARHSLTKAIRYVADGGLVPCCGRCRLSWIV